MGNPFLLQACLRLDEHEISTPLQVGKEYSFTKTGHRLYQLNVPMDLRTKDWKFLGRVVVTEYTVGKGRTTGTFVLVKEFSEQEKEIMTRSYVAEEEVEKVLRGVQ